MNDTSNENLVIDNSERTYTLAHAFEQASPGSPIPTTVVLHRWIRRGLGRKMNPNRIRLEAVKVGAEWRTSVEAIKRFLKRTAESKMEDPPRFENPAARTRS